MFLQKNSNYKPAFDSRLFLYLCTMQFTYPKKEKLKSKTTIDLLFSEGKSVSKYPLRLVFTPLKESDEKLFFLSNQKNVNNRNAGKNPKTTIFRNTFVVLNKTDIKSRLVNAALSDL